MSRGGHQPRAVTKAERSGGLRYQVGMSEGRGAAARVEETAAVLEIPVETVESRLTRALERLAQAVDDA